MKWGRKLVTYFIILLEKNESKRLMQSIINKQSDIVDNLIKELEKPINISNKKEEKGEVKNLGKKLFTMTRTTEDNYLKSETRNISVNFF